MRCPRAILLAILLTTPAMTAEPLGVECGQGRAFWAPLEACVTLPVLTRKVHPDYPNPAPGLRYGATLAVKVLAAGTVGDVQLVKATAEGEPVEDGEAALAAVVEAVRQWRFDPGLDPDGKAIAMTVTLTVHLRTEE